MVVKFSRTNMHPVGDTGLSYQIQLSAGHIEVVVERAAQSVGTLMTTNGDFISCAISFVRDGMLKFYLHKSDVVTGTTLSRIELLGNFKLEIKKRVHKREEIQEFLVNIRR